jgi:DNA-directed RNA polymerase specialized sigma24 family protein
MVVNPPPQAQGHGNRRLTVADVEAAFRLGALAAARRSGTRFGEDDLDEVAQSAWLSYWAARKRVFDDGEDPVRIWVYAYRVGRTQAYRFLRDRWNAEEWDEAWDDDEDDDTSRAQPAPIAREERRLPPAVVHELFQLLLRDRAKKGRRGMQAAFRDVQVVCAVVAGYDDAYIARVAGISIGSVKVYRRRIRDRLRRLAGEVGK